MVEPDLRPRLHYHSDCHFFGGCEQMLLNFFQDERMTQGFAISFSYRACPAYLQGLRRRHAPLADEQPLALFDEAAPGRWARKLPRPLALTVLAVQAALLLRYWILAANVLLLLLAWRGRRIDLLHINNGGYPGASSARAAALAAGLLRVPHVLMVVNNIAMPPRLHEKPFECLLARLLCRQIDVFATGSRTACEALRQRLGPRRAHCICLPNGVPRRAPDETRRTTRARLGLAQSALVFAIVAVHEERKGHHVLLKALALMNGMLAPDRRPLLLIEGSGPREAALRQLVSKLGLAGQVIFTGHERNIANLMRCADLLLLPSLANEDFPNVVLEAMSLSRPVLASALAGIPEQVEDGVTGWLVAPGHTLELARAMARLARDRMLLREAGRRARRRFEHAFTAPLAVGHYLRLYHQLLHGKEAN